MLEKVMVIQYLYRKLFWLATSSMTALTLQAFISFCDMVGFGHNVSKI